MAPKLKMVMSRRMRLLLIIFFCGLFIAAVYIDRQVSRSFQENIQRKQAAGPDESKYHDKYFKVVYVVDGDTVDIAEPDRNKNKTRIRLLGIDTPETKNTRTGIMYFGPEATDEMTRLVRGKKVKVVIDTVSKSRDRYGRLLAYIHLKDNRDVNRLMIENGYAYADLRFAHGRYKEYIEVMDYAIKMRAGLWQDVNLKQLPKWLIREMPSIKEILAEAESKNTAQ